MKNDRNQISSSCLYILLKEAVTPLFNNIPGWSDMKALLLSSPRRWSLGDSNTGGGVKSVVWCVGLNVSALSEYFMEV